MVAGEHHDQHLGVGKVLQAYSRGHRRRAAENPAPARRSPASSVQRRRDRREEQSSPDYSDNMLRKLTTMTPVPRQLDTRRLSPVSLSPCLPVSLSSSHLRRIARSMSRFIDFSLMLCRLSCNCLPRPMPNEHLRAAFREVDLQRDQRQPLFAGPRGEPLDLAACASNSLRGRLGTMVELVRPLVFGNVAADQPDLAAADACVRFLERDLASAHALDLAAHQHDAAFQRVEDLVLEPRLAVVGHDAVVVAAAGRRATWQTWRFCEFLLAVAFTPRVVRRRLPGCVPRTRHSLSQSYNQHSVANRTTSRARGVHASVLAGLPIVETSAARCPATAALAQAERPQGQRQPLHRAADRRAAAGNGLRKRQVPQPHGVLVAEDRHVHDHGQRLHAAVRVLLGAQGQDRGAGARRARARGRGGACGWASSTWSSRRSRATTCPTAGPTISIAACWPCASEPARRSKCSRPTFIGKPGAIERVVEAAPEVFNHNTETVPRLYREVRGRKSDYRWTLALLRRVKAAEPGDQNQKRPDARPGRNARRAVRHAGRPARRGRRFSHARAIPAADARASAGRALSCRPTSSTNWASTPARWAFKQVASGPFVRSSYHAREMTE